MPKQFTHEQQQLLASLYRLCKSKARRRSISPDSPSLIVIIANYASARGKPFVSPEQKIAVITNYCHMAAKCN